MLSTLLGNRIMVKRDPADTETQSGLAITNPEQKNTGTIIMVGPGRDNDPMYLRKGQRVMWSKGTRIEELPDPDGGEPMLLMYSNDIIGTFS